MVYAFHGLLNGPDTRIGTDSMFVIREWARLRDGGCGTYPDLTSELLQSWRRNFTLFKVSAHVDLDTVGGEPWWHSAAKSVADHAAKQSVCHDYQFLRDLVNEMALDAQGQAAEHLLFAKFLVAISSEENRLKKLTRRETSGVDYASLEEVSESEQFQRWLELSPVPAQVKVPPRLEQDWLLACNWPPWFTWPLMHWLGQLSWTMPAENPLTQVGTTYIELIVNFVVVTKVLPPAGHEDLHPAGSPDFAERPRTIRQVTLSFVDAIRQLERLSGQTLLPSRKTKCTCLRTVGEATPRIGVHGRPTFPNPERTFQLLEQLLRTSSVDALLPSSQEYSESMKAPAPVISAYGAMPCNRRATLARWFRNLRRT